MHNNFGEDLRQLDVMTFEIEEINDIGIDAPAVISDEIGDQEMLLAASSSSCSCSSCCSCSTSSCCSCSTSCGSCG